MSKPVEQHSTKLPKHEKLKSKLEIDELFAHARSIKSFPLKLLYLTKDEADTSLGYPKLLVSVPKKKFKRAVDRNLLKRRIREAYRLNKHKICDEKIKSIGIIYVSNQIEPFKIIEDKLILALLRLIS